MKYENELKLAKDRALQLNMEKLNSIRLDNDFDEVESFKSFISKPSWENLFNFASALKKRFKIITVESDKY